MTTTDRTLRALALRCIAAGATALAGIAPAAAHGQSSYERCLQLAQVYHDVAEVRDSGTARDVARTALLAQRDAVTRIGGPRTVDVMLETVYGHPELAADDFEAMARLECVKSAIQ